MNVSRRGWLGSLLAACLVVVLAACAGVPADLQTRTDEVRDHISAVREAISQNTEAFEAQLRQEKYAFIGGYTPQQQHRDKFDQASTRLDEAQQAYDERVKPLLSSYDETRRGDLEAALGDVDGLTNEALALAADPALWLDRVVETKSHSRDLVENARAASNALVANLAALERDAAAVQQVFTAQVAAVDSRVAPLRQQRDTVLAALNDADTEVSRSQPNYAVLATHLVNIEETGKAYAGDAERVRADLDDLSATETRTLVDLRVDSTVEISRTSWNESYDYAPETDYDYEPVLVDAETATFFADRVGQLVAQLVAPMFSGSELRLEEGVSQNHWDALKIDPMLNIGDDNAAEFYVGEIDDTYCEQWRVLRDGQPDRSSRPDPSSNYCSQYDVPSEVAQGIFWVETDELRADDIGMDVYSKGYGEFSDQATTAATPPGLVYVGDPSTGEWRTDANGASFWHYYGQYAFFSQLIGGPNPYHYRSEYDTWNRDYRHRDRPYYAASGGTARYGANSPQTASRFPGSDFVRSGLSNASVRNAGPSARAGGPGGGGK